MEWWTGVEDWPVLVGPAYIAPTYHEPPLGRLVVHDWATREDMLKARLAKLGEDIERFIKRGCRA